MSNILKGRDSFDVTAGNVLVPFFNRNVTPYATEAGGPQFDLVPVEKQKDIMLNVARMHAQQEYDRIVELVRVLESQARQIKRRLEITDAVHAAEYQFQTYHGQVYWLVYEREKQKTILSKTGPNGWSSSAPESYEYIAAVKWLGDHTWQEVTDV
ncbi:DUF2452 domain-containing protein [bacterium]|nr:DUF2452 domain-containing protein [bacterium]